MITERRAKKQDIKRTKAGCRPKEEVGYFERRIVKYDGTKTRDFMTQIIITL